MHYDDEPELAGYEPDAERPLRSRRRQRILRFIVILGIIGLVVPGFLTTWSVASATADRACAAMVIDQAPTAQGFSAQFELFGPGFLGWECYTAGPYAGEHHVGSLGIIPSAPNVSNRQGIPA